MDEPEGDTLGVIEGDVCPWCRHALRDPDRCPHCDWRRPHR